MKFSANLGFLFREFSLVEAVKAAAAAGFAAVECHWPYETPAATLRAALSAARLPLLSINVRPGDRASGDFGVAAIPGREEEARRLIDEAVDYAAAAGAAHVHVLAGRAEGAEARAVFAANLRYADQRLAGQDIGLLVEPLNHRDAPGNFLRRLEDAASLIDALAIPRLKMMFDCYHVQIEGGDLLRRYASVASYVGHIQFAGVPERNEPDRGEVAYDRLLLAIVSAGYGGFFGAEYKPAGGTAASLGWLKRFASLKPDS
jgi:hydroxypyruvate isomerase